MTNSQVSSVQVDGLFRQYNSWLNRWVKRELRLTHQAEDVASEVFIRLLNLPSCAELREPRAMMTTMARRIVYELRRRDKLQRAYEASLENLPAALAPSAEEQIIILETLRAIDAALTGLTSKARKAFFLSQIDGLKYVEIAQIMGISASMVRKYVAKGLRAIYALEEVAPRPPRLRSDRDQRPIRET